MKLLPLLDFISRSKKLLANQFLQTVDSMVENIDGGDGDYCISLLTTDGHFVFVKFRNHLFSGSTSKKIN